MQQSDRPKTVSIGVDHQGVTLMAMLEHVSELEIEMKSELPLLLTTLA